MATMKSNVSQERWASLHCMKTPLFALSVSKVSWPHIVITLTLDILDAIAERKQPNEDTTYIMHSGSSNFEIKIALLGNVSAGKTTVINALLRDQYGEASMKRTTAGINYFRLNKVEQPTNDDSNTLVDETENSDATVSASDNQVATTQEDFSYNRSSESILEEIVQDNIKLRSSNTVQEKYFDINVTRDIVKMRNDTTMILVDVPGINEAGVVNRYKDFVSEKWETFDCVVVVMDGKQGVNTEDQIFLLKLVKENLKKKDVPVIILCNKVDDPDDDELSEMVKEAREEVQKIFNVGCRAKALKQILGEEAFIPYSIKGKQKNALKTQLSISPAFMPISAIHAYIHRSASLMSREKFQTFDKELIEKLGREQIGRRRWNRLSDKEKLDEAYSVVTEGHMEGIQDSNFGKLVSVLGFFLGGQTKQRLLIVKQLHTALKILKKARGGQLTSLVESIFLKVEALSRTEDSMTVLPPAFDRSNLNQVFWQAYKTYEENSFSKFEERWPSGFSELAGPMEELATYRKLALLHGWKDVEETVLEKMKALIKRQISVLVTRQINARDENTWTKRLLSCTNSDRSLHLQPFEWSMIWGSYLLLAGNKHFCDAFALEKMVCDRFSFDCAHWRNNLEAFSADNLDPAIDETGIMSFVQTNDILIDVPDSMSDSNHVAHTAWLFCQYLEQTDA